MKEVKLKLPATREQVNVILVEINKDCIVQVQTLPVDARDMNIRSVWFGVIFEKKHYAQDGDYVPTHYELLSSGTVLKITANRDQSFQKFTKDPYEFKINLPAFCNISFTTVT